MDRNLTRLSNTIFDVLVIGGGIHGAIAAWDAAQRGLSVGLIERGDFGSATSQNSLKVVHGGLRYLQDGNLPRIRMMARERSTWMEIAPHLVHPLPCLTPTYPKLSRSRLAMGLALKLNDWLGFDRNRRLAQDKYLPASRLLPVGEGSRLLPGLDTSGMTGLALWYDAQMYNSERLLLEFVLSASQLGATVANYVQAVKLIHQGNEVAGARVKDALTGREFSIQAKLVINATGVWVNRLLEPLGKPIVQSVFYPSIALNLIVDQIWDQAAVGLPSQIRLETGTRKENWHPQMFFIVPWHDKSIIGTWHIPWPHELEAFRVTDALIQEFIDEVNSAHPGLHLSIDDIKHVHWGFLPMEHAVRSGERVQLTREGFVIDHQADAGWTGLISMVGVKYTTARAIAEKAINLALKKLGLVGMDCQTDKTPVFGGQFDNFQEFLRTAQSKAPASIDSEVIEHLATTYGSQYLKLLEYVAEQPALGQRLNKYRPVIGAEVVHAVRCEMALRLSDVIYRRTELGAMGLPDMNTLQACADIVGRELGWDNQRQADEIEALIEAYPFRRRKRNTIAA